MTTSQLDRLDRIETMDAPQSVAKYAETLEKEGKLKQVTLINIASSLNLHLARLEPDLWLGVPFCIDFDVLARLEKHFNSTFNQDFWLWSAGFVLHRIEAYKQDEQVRVGTEEDIAITSCGATLAGIILRDSGTWDLSANEIEDLLGRSQETKQATRKLSQLQKQLLLKIFKNRDDKQSTPWCPEEWFGIPAPNEILSKQAAWSRALARLENRGLLTRKIEKHAVTQVHLTKLGLATAKRL